KINANVENHRRGEFEIANERQMNVGESARQKRLTEEETGKTCSRGDDEPRSEHPQEIDAHARLRQVYACRDVLKDKRDAGDQPGDETAARQVVAAQQNID